MGSVEGNGPPLAARARRDVWFAAFNLEWYDSVDQVAPDLQIRGEDGVAPAGLGIRSLVGPDLVVVCLADPSIEFLRQRVTGSGIVAASPADLRRLPTPGS